MIPYKKYAPTCYDNEGSFLRGYDESHPDRQDWLVVPVIQTRDSGPFELSNFQAALDLLGGESETVEVHRFGHWGPGWFEIIIVKPDSKAHTQALEIEKRLEDYPVLDEEDFSRREWEDMQETWLNMSMWNRIKLCSEFNVSIFASRRDEVPDDSYIQDRLRTE